MKKQTKQNTKRTQSNKEKLMTELNVLQRDDVNDENREIFDTMKKNLGFVPNIYATMANSEKGLGRFLAYENGPGSLNNREKEVVKLVTSQINGCRYCLSAHTALARMNGFSDEQILEIRGGRAGFDEKLDALAQFTYQAVTRKGNVDDEYSIAFADAGYTPGNLIDVLITITSITTLNYLHNFSQVPVDFPAVPELETV
jgi:AhpD family alkylhydroperoxidase